MNENVLVIIPIGAGEQHGPLGLLGTDYVIPDYISKQLAGMRPDIVGTCNIGSQALYSVLDNLTVSLMNHNIRRFLFLGHGVNSGAIADVANKLFAHGALVAQIDWWSLAPQLNKEWIGGHRAAQEASAMMVARPDWVSMDNCEPTKLNHLSEKIQSNSASGAKKC